MIIPTELPLYSYDNPIQNQFDSYITREDGNLQHKANAINSYLNNKSKSYTDRNLRVNNYKPAVFCPGYYHEFSYNAVIKLTKSNPSSNRPEKCRVCSTYLWSYNMLSHFQDNHHGVPCDFLIIEDEKESVLNFKTGFKN